MFCRSRYPTKRRLLAPVKGGRSGHAVVELAIIALPLCILVFGAIEAGQAMQVSQTYVNNVARQGCRVGVAAGTSTAQIQTAVDSFLQSEVTNYRNSAGFTGPYATTPHTITVLVNDVPADASTAVRGNKITVTVSVPADHANTSSGVTWFLGGKNLVRSVSMRRE